MVAARGRHPGGDRLRGRRREPHAAPPRRRRARGQRRGRRGRAVVRPPHASGAPQELAAARRRAAAPRRRFRDGPGAPADRPPPGRRPALGADGARVPARHRRGPHAGRSEPAARPRAEAAPRARPVRHRLRGRRPPAGRGPGGALVGAGHRRTTGPGRRGPRHVRHHGRRPHPPRGRRGPPAAHGAGAPRRNRPADRWTGPRHLGADRGCPRSPWTPAGSSSRPACGCSPPPS